MSKQNEQATISRSRSQQATKASKSAPKSEAVETGELIIEKRFKHDGRRTVVAIKADPYLVAMAEKIRFYRQKRGISQAVLAALSGNALIAISSIENARSPARVQTLRKIAKALKCHVRDLFPDYDFEDTIEINHLYSDE
jgi:ribosome-binding protein aMBF1 (putative translation factor)